MSDNRRTVLAALARYGVVVLREGGSHTVIGAPGGRQSALPRHADLNRITVRKIVKQLGLDWQEIEKDVS
jgi:predicted RNA binding protein YcfA (HicA-like mRNA interferase family)